MKKLLFAILTITLISCSSDEPRNCCTVISLGADIKYEDVNGINLLNSTDDGYDISEIEVFHKIDGEWKKYYEGNLDYPKGILKSEIDGESYLTIFLSNKTNEEDISETKLKFSEGDEDIIKSIIEKKSGNEIVTKIWYNDELKWPTENSSSRQFTIVK
jgi:hypothetical protein